MNSTSNIGLDEALSSSWSMTSATMILLTGQIGFTLMELSQAGKKNRDFIVLKNMLILLVVLLCWFCVGFSIAFGTSSSAESIQFAGLKHGFFGDLSGGLSNDTDSSKWPADQTTYDETLIFNQRRFFVFFAYSILASNIVSSSISERVLLSALMYFIAL